MLRQGARGDTVRELQHRLGQIGWYDGAITGTYDAATVADVEGFQGKRGLPSSGEVDATTWAKLVAMTNKPTHDQLYNVLKPGKALYRQGSQGDKVKQLQARLQQIGWFSGTISGYYGTQTTAGVKGFQAKREIPVTGEVDQRTWDRLAAMTHTPTAAELSGKPAATADASTAGLDPRCLTGRAMCISKSTDKLVWVVDGKPQLRLDVRFGAQASPTREGVFHVGWKAKDWVSTLYDSPMPFSMFFSGGQAVHYSSDFAARGYVGASHGCVNVRNYNGIAWLFGQVKVGDKVVVYR